MADADNYTHFCESADSICLISRRLCIQLPVLRYYVNLRGVWCGRRGEYCNALEHWSPPQNWECEGGSSDIIHLRGEASAFGGEYTLQAVTEGACEHTCMRVRACVRVCVRESECARVCASVCLFVSV